MTHKTIYLANMSELLYPSYAKSPNKDVVQRIIQSDADRAMLYGSHHKAIITSLAIDLDLANDLLQKLHYKDVVLLHPKNASYSLSKDIMKNKELRGQLLSWLKPATSVELVPYGATRELYKLAAWLRKQLPNVPIEISATPKEKLAVRDYIDTKSGFREIWDRVSGDIRVAKGFQELGIDGIVRAADYFFMEGKDFLVKHNTGVSGWGIEKFVVGNFPSFEKLRTEIASRFADLSVWENQAVVVEECIDIDERILGGSPSIEYKIVGKKDGSFKKQFEYSCEQVLTKNGNFLGIQLSKEVSDHPAFQKMKKDADRFARELGRLGYRGVFDIDFVVGRDGRIYAVESNTRTTGGTHVWDLAKYLLKQNLGNYIVFSNDAFTVGVPVGNYENVKKKIADLFWGTYAEDEGLVISGTSMLEFGKFGYIILGKKPETIDMINSELRKRFKSKEE